MLTDIISILSNTVAGTIPIVITNTNIDIIVLSDALYKAVLAGGALSISHAICVLIIMYLDLSGKWAKYSLNKNRTVSLHDYSTGMQSFIVDLFTLFIPFMTICFYYSNTSIVHCTDTIPIALIKLSSGYFIGKVWAFVIHYMLHMPSLYKYHRRHHRNPKAIVASASWEDSFIEYAVMELPSFGLCVCVFPTHFWIHCCHFALHGWDGACGHSGYKGPGILGYLFDGEYHYYHHAYLTINYAELEIIDLLMGTHHSQRKNFTCTTTTTTTTSTTSKQQQQQLQQNVDVDPKKLSDQQFH